jgi:hypothetical protein
LKVVTPGPKQAAKDEKARDRGAGNLRGPRSPATGLLYRPDLQVDGYTVKVLNLYHKRHPVEY